MKRPKTKNPPPAGHDETGLPAHALEAEAAVLACCLLDEECVPEALEKLAPAAFFELRHRLIYEAIGDLYRDQKAVDLLLVHQQLRDRGELEKIGGSAFLAGVSGAVTSAANLAHYLETVRDKWLLRRVGAALAETHLLLADGEAKAGAVVERLIAKAIELGETHVRAGERRIGEYIPEIEERLEEMHRGKQQMQGHPTGFYYLDNMLCGLIPGDYYVLAARPSVGKTALAVQIAEHVAEQGTPVGVFSLEMSGRALAERSWFGRAEAHLQKYRNGFIPNEDYTRLATAAPALHKLPLYVDEASGLNIQQLAIRARRMARKLGVKLFVIDYLQLLAAAPGRESENRNYELGGISKKIKELGKELQCPFLVLAQMNRDWEKDPSRKPQLSDLRDSGQVEQDADTVMFLYDLYLTQSKQDDLNCKEMAWLRKMPDGQAERVQANWRKFYRPINLLVAKQRNGPTGDVELVYRKQTLRFVDRHPDASRKSRPGPDGPPAREPNQPEML